jgi:Zn-dependent protease
VSSAAGAPLPGTRLPEIDQLKATVGQFFPVYETRITPHSLLLLVHADPSTLESRFDQLRQLLWSSFYIPQIRFRQGEYQLEIVRRMPRRPWSSAVNLALLGLTVASTAAAGAFLWLSYRGGFVLGGNDLLNGALYFGAPLMAILGLHELAHFIVARRHHVEASLPYFIPVPPPYLIFGTFGAFISLREPIPSRKALLDIGASGPIAGFLVAVPVTLGGLALSIHAPVLPLTNCGPTILGANYGNLLLGTSAIYYLLSLFVPSTLVSLHPLAVAGWVGLLVTAMNLLPAGQLDGGHVFRALLGDRSRFVSYGAVALLFGLGLLYLGWIFFALLILFLGVRHPPPLNDISRLDARRWVVGAVAVAVLLGGFVAVPLTAPTGAFTVPVHAAGNSTPPAGYALAGNGTLAIHNADFVAHGYVLSGNIESVIVRSNNTNRTLSGAELAAFEANSTWRIVFSDGVNVSAGGSGNWTMPSGSYFEIDPGTTGRIVATYLNTESAQVTFAVSFSEVCQSSGGSARYLFTIG